MARRKSRPSTPDFQARTDSLTAEILDSVDATKIVRRLFAYRLNGGPRTHAILPLWRAYLLSFILNTHSTNDLIRRLRYSSELRDICGFGPVLPGRRTFNRFINRLADHADLVQECIAPLTENLRDHLPELGDKVAVDSSNVPTYSNKSRKPPSDPEASWTKKEKPSAPKGEEWHWGYKLHLAVDAEHHVPLSCYVTTASKHDSPELPKLVDQVLDTHAWIKPKYVLADRGYDADSNHRHVMAQGALLIAPARKKGKQKGAHPLYDGVFDERGVPFCMGMVPMEYVRSDPEKGHLYRCPSEGCPLKDRKGVVYCQDEYWASPEEIDNPRLVGPIRQNSAEWKALYAKRWSVERVFKSLKESLRLSSHCHRGLARVNLHAITSVLSYTATLLVKTLCGMPDSRWMVPRVL